MFGWFVGVREGDYRWVTDWWLVYGFSGGKEGRVGKGRVKKVFVGGD